jgi:hypothetical protein
MHDLAAHLAMLLGFPINGGNLHKVWPRAGYQENSHNVTLALRRARLFLAKLSIFELSALRA